MGLEEKLSDIKNQVVSLEPSLQLGFKSGIYMPLKRDIAPSLALDRARYACFSVKKYFSHDIAFYNGDMDDDFGSGYSGLNVLKDFTFDMMKIDMKFLSKFSENEKTRPILSSIIALAKNIGMQTLTEGVETKDAYSFLKSIGCERLQGYLFGKPMPKDEFLKKILSGEYSV